VHPLPLTPMLYFCLCLMMHFPTSLASYFGTCPPDIPTLPNWFAHRSISFSPFRTSYHFSCTTFPYIMAMEAVGSSETSANFYEATRRCIILLGCATVLLVPSISPTSSTLKIQATDSSESPALICQTTRRHVLLLPEHDISRVF